MIGITSKLRSHFRNSIGRKVERKAVAGKRRSGKGQMYRWGRDVVEGERRSGREET